jgi:hypothetical protein
MIRGRGRATPSRSIALESTDSSGDEVMVGLHGLQTLGGLHGTLMAR